MSSIVTDTLRVLEETSRETDQILVAYSGGKDSLAVLDLCSRAFPKCEAFFMYLVPGLECVERMLDYARARWGVTIHQYPHWCLHKFLTNEVYCWPRSDTHFDVLPEWKLRHVYELAQAETGISHIATGAKEADSLWRRRSMGTAKFDNVIYPIRRWSKFDVLGYLKGRNIPNPASSGHAATGVDLSTPSLLWLHDAYPDDFKRLCEVFPFAEAVVARRRFHGVTT